MNKIIKKLFIFILIFGLGFLLVSCQNEEPSTNSTTFPTETTFPSETIIPTEFEDLFPSTNSTTFPTETTFPSETIIPTEFEDLFPSDIYPLAREHENEIYYSIFVRSFADSDGDGIGDLNGVTRNLDYLTELGITAIWLLPIFKSPSYHGYDTTDYYQINEDYGTMTDLENLLHHANKRGIKIILDLVINHTSDQHPWYLNAISSPSAEYRDYYYWKDGGVYESFVGGMKDLNLENKDVVAEINNIAKFYLDKGVAGFRIDAVSHLFEEHGTHVAIAKNMIFMVNFNHYVKSVREDAFVVGEVYVNDYNILNQYVRSQASYFNFYLQSEIESKIAHGNSRTNLSTVITRNYSTYYNTYGKYVDSPFLGNHDMDRIASIYNETQLRQALGILLTLPGNPFIYYGDELGMKGLRYEGSTIGGKTVYDEYRRQPFLWGDKRNTTWLASDGSNDLTKSYLEQKDLENSIFNFTKEMIALRKANPSLMDGLEVYKSDYVNGVQAYIRVINKDEKQQALLVLHNVYDRIIETDLNLELVYGEKVMPGYSMTIFELPFAEWENYQ